MPKKPTVRELEQLRETAHQETGQAEVDPLENSEVSQPPLTLTIDDTTHQSLLEQSLREYKEIWEDLANR